MLALTTFSDLGIILKLIKKEAVAFWALKIFVLKFDAPNKILRLLLRRDGRVEFNWIKANVLHLDLVHQIQRSWYAF